ncbi:MAG TPA: hypothetical protein VMD76_02560 [Candidatus Sulfotelmatobacter sp.]|nr:hypothetical protein [Candidatus Sulfotelmatobacter sp.]
MTRRDFLGSAAAAAAIPVATEAASINVDAIKIRKTPKPQIAYKSPHAKPNGLQATAEGLWVMDQGRESYVTLVNFADGKVVRDFKADVVGASGITVDADNVMWITSTHNSLVVSCSPQDGKTIAKYWTPGAGRIYRKASDVPAARSPLPPAFPPQANAGRGRGGRGRGGRGHGNGLPYGQLALETENGAGGTGAHGIEHRDGLLYFACPPARRLFVMDPKSWEVQDFWPLPGNRPHGVGWEGDTLWVADSNLRAFFRHDIRTGNIIERIQLTEKDPLIHGATVHEGHLWYCDDVGYICNLKL